MLLPAGVVRVIAPVPVVWTILPPEAVPMLPPAVRFRVPPPTWIVPTFNAFVSVIETELPVLKAETEAKLLFAFVKVMLPAPASNVAALPPTIAAIWSIESAAAPAVLTLRTPLTFDASSVTAPVATMDAFVAVSATAPPNVLVRFVNTMEPPVAVNDEDPPRFRTELGSWAMPWLPAVAANDPLPVVTCSRVSATPLLVTAALFPPETVTDTGSLKEFALLRVTLPPVSVILTLPSGPVA